MSCRHDLALGTCRECYPKTGTITPEGPGDSMDGPGAVPRGVDWDVDEEVGDVVRLELGCMTFVIDQDHEMLTIETDIDPKQLAEIRSFCTTVARLFNESKLL